MEAGERKALDDIERYGCHIIHVMEEGEQPPFSYTVGVQQASGAPELIVIGLKQALAHSILNGYNDRVRGGERFCDGQLYSDFVEGFDCLVREVDPVNFPAYLGWNLWLYKGKGFKVLQLLYPDTSGVWPWQNEADAWFKVWQPVLAVPSIQ